MNYLVPGQCRICDAAHNDPLDNVSQQENDTHESEHVPTSNAHYLRSTGRVVRLNGSNRWVQREPAWVPARPQRWRTGSGHWNTCEDVPGFYDSECPQCRKSLLSESVALDELVQDLACEAGACSCVESWDSSPDEPADSCPECHCGRDDCPTPRDECGYCGPVDASADDCPPDCEDCAADEDAFRVWGGFDPADPPDEPVRITDEAWGLVMGARQSDYNHPADDFKATGRQWGALLTNWLHAAGYELTTAGLGVDVPDVPAKLVALMMAQLKFSRESHKPKRDNRVDAIGYVLCADRIEEGY